MFEQDLSRRAEPNQQLSAARVSLDPVLRLPLEEAQALKKSVQESLIRAKGAGLPEAAPRGLEIVVVNSSAHEFVNARSAVELQKSDGPRTVLYRSRPDGVSVGARTSGGWNGERTDLIFVPLAVAQDAGKLDAALSGALQLLARGPQRQK